MINRPLLISFTRSAKRAAPSNTISPLPYADVAFQMIGFLVSTAIEVFTIPPKNKTTNVTVTAAVSVLFIKIFLLEFITSPFGSDSGQTS